MPYIRGQAFVTTVHVGLKSKDNEGYVFGDLLHQEAFAAGGYSKSRSFYATGSDLLSSCDEAPSCQPFSIGVGQVS